MATPQDSTSTAALAEKAESITTLSGFQEKGIDMLISLGTKILIAGLIIIVGFWLARKAVKLVNKFMATRDVDETLRPFLRGFTSFFLKGIILIIAISTMGVEMTSIIAVLGSVGLAIGLALQGALANFAGGVIILALKPFSKDDLIEAQGVTGFVKEISIISTTLATLDNKTIFIPNGPLAGGNIINYTKEDTRMVDMTFGIGYADDIDKARQVLNSIVAGCPHVIQEPAPFIAVKALADSSVNFAVRIWTHTANYWDVYFYMMENVKKTFDKEGVSIPFPQRDVHLHQVPASK